jgi:hypothetical protein
MKTRQFTILVALLGLLIASSVLAYADEPKLVPITTSLSSTTVSGYVIATHDYTPTATPTSTINEHQNWYETGGHILCDGCGVGFEVDC